MSLCESIDTLAMAFLDDELVAEERRELELHMLSCTSCKQHVDAERADLSLIRKALVAPPAPDLLKARVTRALDEEDRAVAKAGRFRWTKYVLPGGAIAAAAAAIVAFIAIRPPAANEASIRNPAIGKAIHTAPTVPLEVDRAVARTWLEQNFTPNEVSAYERPGLQIDLVDQAESTVSGYPAHFLQYLLSEGPNRFTLTAVVMLDVPKQVLQGGKPYQVGDRVLRVHDANGMAAVTYVDEYRTAYTFTSKRLTAEELLKVVVSTDLIRRAEQGR